MSVAAIGGLIASVVATAEPSGGRADHTPAPASVTIAGSLQSELGCTGDWQADCATTHAVNVIGDVWKATFTVPAGEWEYKTTINDSWTENYGLGGVPDGPNIPLSLAADTSVRFYYSHATHWTTDSARSRIVTAPGSYQSELGCPGDWQPDCLRSWLQDPDGDGTYEFSTSDIPAGTYDAKATIDESWDENYGAGGALNGGNIGFSVADGQSVTFTFVSATNTLTITTSGGSGGGIEPGDELLVRDPVRPGADEMIYFVMPDRFANGEPSNDHGGDTSGDPIVDGFLPDHKGYYHGGDLAGLTAQLDYLDQLGITAIWITPPFKNDWVQGDGTIGGSSAAYHGYWQVDYTQIDPHFGTNAEMQSFVADAHARGIDVLFDIVPNHTGDVITYAEDEFTYRSKADFPYRDAAGDVFDDRDFVGTSSFPTLDSTTSFPYTP
ncbi:MAG TPA: alpha-amylase family glycosyl hydrolase, partial [Ilumatobacteraceae bacterium]|nr:alpha-amylase family glycosyl hydrolase [Ilumatobacteraceae bacterium]